MNYLRKANERGHANHGWLNSYHSFSFASYYDPKHMGVSALRVINDDTVAAGEGFGAHGHEDMEIISYVLQGSIEHRDSMGHVSVLKAGEVQRMSAGTGVRHSEYNPSATEPLHFLQIWILPKKKSVKPSYEQKRIEQTSTLTPLVTPDGTNGSLTMNQDAGIYRLELKAAQEFSLKRNDRSGYLHILSGSAQIGESLVAKGDGIGLTSAPELNLTANAEGLQALWFELP